jgi:acyl phosphate:glycerol-3-phosphate acyltransferase
MTADCLGKWICYHGHMSREMLLSLLIGYVLGSIPFGLILTRLAGKGDVRKIGSGNIGATNVLRTGSKLLAAATLILDCLKATAAILLARQLFGDPLNDLAQRYAAAGAMIGHLYPAWLKFRGGKGVSTFLGVLLGLQLWVAAAIYAFVWIILLLTLRISSVAGMSAVMSVPLAGALLGERGLLPLLLGFALLVLWKHRDNILRLRKGTEPRLGSKISSTG